MVVSIHLHVSSGREDSEVLQPSSGKLSLFPGCLGTASRHRFTAAVDGATAKRETLLLLKYMNI